MTKQEFTPPNETEHLRTQLARLVQEICSTVAHQVRPQALREAIASSQKTLKRDGTM
jgi:hypothetical protein